MFMPLCANRSFVIDCVARYRADGGWFDTRDFGAVRSWCVIVAFDRWSRTNAAS